MKPQTANYLERYVSGNCRTHASMTSAESIRQSSSKWLTAASQTAQSRRSDNCASEPRFGRASGEASCFTEPADRFKLDSMAETVSWSRLPDIETADQERHNASRCIS